MTDSLKQNKLIYDSDCGICTYFAILVQKKCKDNIILTASIDIDNLPEKMKNQSELLNKTVVFEVNGNYLIEARAITEVLKYFPFPFSIIGKVFGNRVFGWIFAPFYRLIANHRSRISRLFGLNACRLPK